VEVGRTGCLMLSGQIKIVAPLETCTRHEQHSVIHVFSSEGVKPNEMLIRMKTQYGDACLALQQVCEWDRKFKNGVFTVADADCPSQPHTAYTPETVEQVEQVVTRKPSCYN
jgi:hypothetical protein